MALIGATFFNGLHAPFVYDDKIEVVGNATIRDLTQLRAVLEYNVNRVLLILTYAWNFRSFGLDPFGYHVTSVVIHGMVIWSALHLAVGLGRMAGHPRPLAVAATACGVWSIHPMVTEGVTYITGRSESLCALFVLSTLAVWARALEQEAESGSTATGQRLLALVLCVASMGTKEVALMTPFALVWMEYLFGQRSIKWRWYAPFAGAGALGVVGRALYAEHLIPREVDRPLLTQISTQAEVWARYVGLWAVPVRQTLYHHIEDVALFSPRGAVAWLIWGLGAMGAVRWSRGRPLVAFALGCAALFLVPSSSFVALKESMAEHRAYVTGLYLALAVVWTVPPRLVRWLLVAGAAVMPVLMWATMERNRVWSSEVALWEEATALSPEVAEAWYGLGDAHRFSGDMEASVSAFQTAVERDETHLDSWNNMGIVWAQMGEHRSAKDAWQSALRIDRTYCKAHSNLGLLASQRGAIEDAIVNFRTAIQHCPNNIAAHYGLGTIYADGRRNPDRAVFHFEALLKLDPGFSRAEEVKKRLLDLTW
jgi:Flp pilus assembly protein TadD